VSRNLQIEDSVFNLQRTEGIMATDGGISYKISEGRLYCLMGASLGRCRRNTKPVCTEGNEDNKDSSLPCISLRSGEDMKIRKRSLFPSLPSVRNKGFADSSWLSN
jgi:hypothetical protein